jgi:hypothetical protein
MSGWLEMPPYRGRHVKTSLPARIADYRPKWWSRAVCAWLGVKP